MNLIPPVRIELRPSRLIPNEVGLFTVQSIGKDDVVIEASAFVEIAHPWTVYEQLDVITQQKIMKFCCGSETGFFAPGDFNRLPICWYMNHCCEPSVGFDDDDNFVATRNIAAGEELCWDYGFAETNPDSAMQCLCGSIFCRGVITGNDWKNPAFVEKNRAYFLRELLRKADRLKGVAR